MNSPRWKLLVVLLALPAVGWAIARWSGFSDQGLGGVIDLGALVLGLLLGLVWLLFLSGLSGKARLLGVVVVAVLGAGLAFLVRTEGHMGDFFPQIAWRWEAQPAAALPEIEGLRERANLPVVATPGDYPQFLGPHRSNWVAGLGLAPDWFARPPQEIWRRPVGAGWGGFAIVGPLAYTLEQRGDREVVVCYEARTGEPVWFHADPVRFDESMGGVGPRTTPTVHEGRVITLGATGILNCLDAASGKKLWSRETLEGQENLMWGKSSSPLISGSRVVITLGKSDDSSVAAFDLQTGATVWTSGGDRPGYGSAIEGVLAGKQQIILFQENGLQGFDPDNGRDLWAYPVSKASAHNATPRIVGNDRVLFGAGYGKGSHLVQVDLGEAPGTYAVTEVWHSSRMKPKLSDFVVHGGYTYLLDEGVLACIDLRDGRRVWRDGRYGHGQILGVGEHLLIQAERGGVEVVRLDPAKRTVVSSFEALDSKTWNHMALAGRLLVVRNDREAVAFAYPGSKE